MSCTDSGGVAHSIQQVYFTRARSSCYSPRTCRAFERKGAKCLGAQLRYAAADDFGLPETAFAVCTLWYIDALAAIGRRDEAREIFEHVLSCRNYLGLLSEDIDLATGELWDNYPQTYSMVGLIVSAMRLSKTWEEAFWRNW